MVLQRFPDYPVEIGQVEESVDLFRSLAGTEGQHISGCSDGIREFVGGGLGKNTDACRGGFLFLKHLSRGFNGVSRAG